MDIRFCPLVSGSSGNAIYVGSGDTNLLIDAGVSGAKVTAALAEIGLSPAELNGILVTHEHSDHVCGVGVLSRRYNLPVYASEGTWAAMPAKLGAIDAHNRRIFTPDQNFYLGKIEVSPFSVPHDAADPVGFTLSAGTLSATVMTDLGVLRKKLLSRIAGSNLVLLESNHDEAMLRAGRYPYELKRRILGGRGHLSNDAAADAAIALMQSGTRKLILGHLSGENNMPELAYQTVAIALTCAGIAPEADAGLTVAARDRRGDLTVIHD